MENMQVNLSLIKEKERRVVITDDRICPVAGCRRKIGDAAFGVLPNSKVTHYMCLNPDALHICPVTTYNFETRKKATPEEIRALPQPHEKEGGKKVQAKGELPGIGEADGSSRKL